MHRHASGPLIRMRQFPPESLPLEVAQHPFLLLSSVNAGGFAQTNVEKANESQVDSIYHIVSNELTIM